MCRNRADAHQTGDRTKEAMAKEMKRANRVIEKEIDAEAEETRKQMDAAVDEALTTT